MTILLATPSNRPVQLRGLVDSLRRTAIGRDWMLVIGHDPWDGETRDAAARLGCLTVELPSECYHVANYDGLNPFNVTQATNYLVRGRTWDKFWAVNDDMRCLTYGWDKAIADVPNGYLGVVHSSGAPATCGNDFPVFTPAHLQAHGDIWPQQFCGWGADSWVHSAFLMSGMEWDTGVCVAHGQQDHARMEALMMASRARWHELPSMADYVRAVANAAGLDFDGGQEPDNDDDVDSQFDYPTTHSI